MPLLLFLDVIIATWLRMTKMLDRGMEPFYYLYHKAIFNLAI